jgi:hypothetical protein
VLVTTTELMQPVKVGEVDPMSQAARRFGLPLCGTEVALRRRFVSCTRPVGHKEAKPAHPAYECVATDQRDVVVAVLR